MLQTTNQYNFITMTPCTIATTRNPQHKCRRVGAISRSAELKMTWCFFFSNASGLINGKVRESHQFLGGVRAVWWLSPWSIYGAIYRSLMEWRTKPPGHLGHSLASVPVGIHRNSPEHFPSPAMAMEPKRKVSLPRTSGTCTGAILVRLLQK